MSFSLNFIQKIRQLPLTPVNNQTVTAHFLMCAFCFYSKSFLYIINNGSGKHKPKENGL